jgi:predicted ATP-grasp superfamily ATP-dependent carboligase
MADAKECWKNATAGMHAVVKVDLRGNIIHENVPSGKLLYLSKEERMINQERCVSTDLDVFQNGVFVPVRLVDPEDELEFASNPNLITEDEMPAMFKLHHKKFDDKIAAITNVYAVNRLLELAVEMDATHRQVQKLQDRLAELEPHRAVDSNIETFGEPIKTGVSTPR